MPNPYAAVGKKGGARSGRGPKPPAGASNGKVMEFLDIERVIYAAERACVNLPEGGTFICLAESEGYPSRCEIVASGVVRLQFLPRVTSNTSNICCTMRPYEVPIIMGPAIVLVHHTWVRFVVCKHPGS